MKVKIGIIGTGFARRVQIPAFKKCPDAEVVSVASASLANARATAEEFGIGHFTDNWRETIERADTDLICISSPPSLHSAQAIFALDRNKHVLCEKPMAIDRIEAAAMARLARERKVLALIDHELRFQPGRLKAFRMLRDGAIGKIRHARYIFKNPQRGDPSIPWNWWSDEMQGGGALGAIGSHAIDSLQWFLGAAASDVFCQMRTRIGSRVDNDGNRQDVTSDDECNLTLGFSDGPLTEKTTGSIFISMVEYPDYQHSMELSGTEGAMRIGYKGEIFLAKGNAEWNRAESEIGDGIEGVFDSGFPSGFVQFAPKLINAIIEKKEALGHAATFEDGLAVQQVLDAARESNRNGCVVKIK